MNGGFQPPPPVGELPDPDVVRATLDRGRYAGCCMCDSGCWTWWSPSPPSGYVPIHEKCVGKLFEHWRKVLTGEIETVEEVRQPVTAKRVGAYARLTSTVAVASTSQPMRSRRTAAILPDGFRPGSFWLPGDTADSPWITVAVTAIGVMACPQITRDRAAGEASRLELLRETTDRIPVVGAVLVAPDGTWVPRWGRWGKATNPVVRHEGGEQPFTVWCSVTRSPDWWTCAGCHEVRWPGTWKSFARLHCLPCLRDAETNDPRPSLYEPPYPGDGYLPDWFTKPARPLGLPRGFGRRGSSRR